MKLSRTTAASLALIPVIVIALVFGAYLSISLSSTTTSSTHQAATTSATSTETISSFTSDNSFSTSAFNMSTVEASSVTVVSSSSISSISTSTFSTQSVTGTGTSIPGWEFLARIVITGLSATVSSNLTYTGSQNSTIEIGYPLSVTLVKNASGSVIWSTVTTALLRTFNVTFGQSFTSTVNVSGVLQSGMSYTFIVRPQINSQTGEFLGGQLQLSFGIAVPLGETQEASNTNAVATNYSRTSS